MSEDTQAIEKGNEALIQQMLRDAQKADEPGDLKTNPIIHKGDAELQAPMTVKEVSSAGYVWVWDTRTYEKIPILHYMLPSKLRQRRNDGSFIFTTVDPGKLPKRGSIKCLLHADGENREHYNQLGFRVCPKDNIINQYQLEQHMKKKHPQEWQAIEQERIKKEKDEDRALQHLLLTSQMNKQKVEVAEVSTETVLKKDKPKRKSRKNKEDKTKVAK